MIKVCQNENVKELIKGKRNDLGLMSALFSENIAENCFYLYAGKYFLYTMNVKSHACCCACNQNYI